MKKTFFVTGMFGLVLSPAVAAGSRDGSVVFGKGGKNE